MKNIYVTKKEMQKEYDEQIKRYCPDCGAQMLLKKFISMYSPSSGEPYYQLEGRCPNARWYKFNHAPRIYPMPVVRRMKQGNFGTKMI